jgi:hypothetical protein
MGRQDCKTWLCHTGANRRRSLPACENACLVDETRRTNPTTKPTHHTILILLFEPPRMQLGFALCGSPTLGIAPDHRGVRVHLEFELVAEIVETLEVAAATRDETRLPAEHVGKGAEAVVFQLEDPPGIVEGLAPLVSPLRRELGLVSARELTVEISTCGPWIASSSQPRSAVAPAATPAAAAAVRAPAIPPRHRSRRAASTKPASEPYPAESAGGRRLLRHGARAARAELTIPKDVRAEPEMCLARA